MNSTHLLKATYLGLVILQPLWHALLPPPYGSGNWFLATIATVPLLLPLKGLMANSLRSMTWAGYLVMLYLVVGIMEAWSNPAQRVAALTQTALVIVFVGSVLVFSRRQA